MIIHPSLNQEIKKLKSGLSLRKLRLFQLRIMCSILSLKAKQRILKLITLISFLLPTKIIVWPNLK